MKTSTTAMRKFYKAMGLTAVVLSLGFVSVSFAASGSNLTGVASNIASSVGSIAKILIDLALVAGVGFVMASFFKMHQHKLNPTQVPISQGITLLLIGAALMLIPYLIPIAAKAVLGSNAKTATTKGTAITNLITGNG